MRLIPVLLAAATAAALGAISTAAEARDGCGRGMYYNGYRCVPERYERGPDPRFYPGREFYRGGYRDDYRGYRNDYRGYRDGPPSERRSGGACPKNYTVQDGVCKPYTGR